MEDNTELMTIDNIYNRVYFIRGQQVMFDYDLADIYGYEVKRLNEQVKRNIVRFPGDFMFQLTKDEIDYSQGIGIICAGFGNYGLEEQDRSLKQTLHI